MLPLQQRIADLGLYSCILHGFKNISMVFTRHLLAKIFLKVFSWVQVLLISRPVEQVPSCLGPGGWRRVGSVSPPVFMGNVRHVLSVEIVC